MSWQGHLNLEYRRDGDRTTAHDRHHGPLRVLQRLYPEGPTICHHVLVHPPGGIVGGDVLEMEAHLGADSHALITTPGATRFYRSAGPLAEQSLSARLDEGARLEWLPLETIAYRGSHAENRMKFHLAPSAEMIGWDVLALGLPAAREAFDNPADQHSRFTQQVEIPGVWLERGTVKADDQVLLDSPLGWAGKRVLATMWFACGSPIAKERAQAMLEFARAEIEGHPLGRQAGCTQAHDEVIVLRVLADRVEPAMSLLTRVWSTWRQAAWQLPADPPRIWRM